VIEVHGSQVIELVEIGQEEITAFRHSFSDGFVKGDDLWVLGVSLCHKLL
jgi:hypothetical protein